MSGRIQILAGSLALVAIAALAGIALAVRGSAPSETEWLITYGARSAGLTGDEGGQGTLEFTTSDSSVLLFSDRPERLTATLSISELAAQWEDAFSSSAPNAALVDDATGDAVAVLTLGRPTVAGDQVTFPVTILDLTGDPSTMLQRGAHLFIDPPAARLTDFHECPMVTPGPVPIPSVGGPASGPGAPSGIQQSIAPSDLITVGPPPDAPGDATEPSP